MQKTMDIGARLARILKTLYLFGKSDILVVVLPSTAVALILAGPSSFRLMLKAFLWIQLHLLTFQVKNQIDGVEEDRLAKSHRPIPSGRISLEHARLLYVVLFTLMWTVGVYALTVECTFVYTVAIVAYNEGGLAKVPIVKNVVGAIGLACYCWGPTVILDHGRQLGGMKAIAVMMMGAIFATTGHAQDFRDRSADECMDRKTIPLLLSQTAARWSLAVLIIAWTVGVVALWKPPIAASVAFAGVGLRCLHGYISSYDERDDHVSYRWYGVWLLGANVLPLFARLRGEI